MKLPPLILASASPRRTMLLQELGLEFQVIPGNAEETHPEFLTPSEICQVNAHRKAWATGTKHPDALVVGADTIVCLEDRIFGKPTDMAEAERMLLQLQGHTHRVVTGVCLFHYQSRRQKIFSESTLVTFRPLGLPEIRAYFCQANPLDKAGAYGIQEGGELIVESIAGSFSNVVGLPVERLRMELERWEKDQ